MSEIHIRTVVTPEGKVKKPCRIVAKHFDFVGGDPEPKPSTKKVKKTATVVQDPENAQLDSNIAELRTRLAFAHEQARAPIPKHQYFTHAGSLFVIETIKEPVLLAHQTFTVWNNQLVQLDRKLDVVKTVPEIGSEVDVDGTSINMETEASLQPNQPPALPTLIPLYPVDPRQNIVLDESLLRPPLQNLNSTPPPKILCKKWLRPKQPKAPLVPRPIQPKVPLVPCPIQAKVSLVQRPIQPKVPLVPIAPKILKVKSPSNFDSNRKIGDQVKASKLRTVPPPPKQHLTQQDLQKIYGPLLEMADMNDKTVVQQTEPDNPIVRRNIPGGAGSGARSPSQLIIDPPALVPISRPTLAQQIRLKRLQEQGSKIPTSTPKK